MRNPQRRRARPRDESGQVTTGLVMVVMVGLLAVALLGVFGLSRGVDERSKAQSAADAAALAGAGALQEAVPAVLALLTRPDQDLGSLVTCNFGRDDADAYATSNDATITYYCFDFAADRVEVEVEMNDDVSADVGPAEAGAIASTGLDLADCSWDTEEPPAETETPTPDPDPSPSGPPSPPESPPPPPDLGSTLECGPLTAQFTVGGESGLLTLDDFELDDLEPSLVD